jgi:hypothetical protein
LKPHPQNTEDADAKFEATFVGKKWFQRLLLNKMQTISKKCAVFFFILPKQKRPFTKKNANHQFHQPYFFILASLFLDIQYG